MDNKKRKRLGDVMKKKIVKKEIQREIKTEKIIEVIIVNREIIDKPQNIIPQDNLIFEVPPVNKQQKKETEKL